MKSKYYWFLFTALVLIGFFLRTNGILEGNFFFTFDQGRDVLDVQKIADGKLTLIGPHTAIGGIFAGPLYYYILLIPFLIGGGNPAFLVLLFGLWGVASYIYGYFLVGKTMGWKTAMFFLTFSVISSPLISFSRYIHNPNPIAFLMILLLFCYYKVVVDRKGLFLSLAFLIIGIMLQFEYSFSFFLVPATLIILLLTKNHEFLKSKFLIIGLILLISTFLPQIVFDFKHDHLMTKAFIGVLKGEKNDLFVKADPFLERLKQREYIPWDDFSTAVGIDWRSIALFWLLLSSYGFFQIFREKSNKFKKMVQTLLILLTTIYIGFIIYPGPVWGWYRIGFPVIFILLVSIGINKIWQTGGKKIKAAAVLVFVFMYFTQIAHLISEQESWKLTKQLGLMRNEIRVLDFIYRDAQDSGVKNFGLLVYTPPIYDYAWQHLINWYGKNKYNYVPSREKESTFYLIIEPDPEQPWRVKGWLETVIKDGNIIKSEKFEDGIIVEKRTL